MADPPPDTGDHSLGSVNRASATKEPLSLLAASKALWAKFRKPGEAQIREISTPLSSQALKASLTEIVCKQILTHEAYEADKDNWAPKTFAQWQTMYLKSYCTFNYTDQRLNATLFMRHWEYMVSQSMMFDPDHFQDGLNAMVNEFGWFVESFTMPDQTVTVSFRRFNGTVMVRHPPQALYYFAAAWNKADILKNGLLPTTIVDPTIGRRVAEYDVLFKTFNLDQIRAIAQNMYDMAVGSSNSDDVSTNILRLIGHMPIIVFRINPINVAEHVWTKKNPVYDEDKETGILLSYTYLPAPVFETVMHEDQIPDILGRM